MHCADGARDQGKPSRAGRIVGGVLAPLSVMAAIVIAGMIVMQCVKKKRKQKEMERFQRDIFARYIQLRQIFIPMTEFCIS